ncbi:MAG: hypothetical protein HZB37_08705 [Planctomycetes bacterium]|nr:hypothetical protein [Planctomycetota bacterium]
MDETGEKIQCVEVTERDIQLFRYLNEQKYMTSDLFWPESAVRTGTGRQRLTRLVEGGYVKIHDFVSPAMRLFLLAAKGLEELRARSMDHGLTEMDVEIQAHVKHTLKMVEIRSAFEKMGPIKWVSERMLRKYGGARKHFPDAVIEYKGLKTAVELENSIKGKGIFLAKLDDYCKSSEFDLVIYVVSWLSVLSWLIDVDVPQDKITYALYDDLMKKKGDCELKNLSGSIKAGSLFS